MDEKSVLIFGAGKIGRSFIGQLFGLAGYQVVFVDVDPGIVRELNIRKSYPVVIKGKTDEIIVVPNVRAVSGLDNTAVINEISRASLMAVSVGKNALEKIIPRIAEGLLLRNEKHPNWPLDIIIAEKMRSAGIFIYNRLSEILPKNYPIDNLVGLVETSIGKMVPIMTEEDLKEDPLLIFAESYNSLVLDKHGFKGSIPNVPGLSPKENIKAWVDRKAFIHNMGHASAAYFGNFFHPEANFIYEVLQDSKVFSATRNAMMQAANVLIRFYPGDFSLNDLELHVDDLLSRFQNRALKDTIFRVGQDLPRKLGINDRFAGIIQMAMNLGATPSSGISLVAYKNLIKYMHKEHLQTYIYDVVQEVVQPEMKLLDHFGVDVLDIGRDFNQIPGYWHQLELTKGFPGLHPKWFNPQFQKDGSWLSVNDTGEAIGRMPEGATFFDQIVFPYQDQYPDSYSNLGTAMKRVVWGSYGFTPWDWIEQPDFWKMLREKTLKMRQETDKAILVGVGCNLFEWGTFLRRMDNFLMDLFLNPDEVHRLLDALMDRQMNFLKHVCESVGDIVDIVKFGDDLGTNNGPLIPNESYNEFFKPRHKLMCDYVKSNSSMHTMLHSCGGIYELIPELIDCGFEILNPVQTNARNMDARVLKNEFGSALTFWGGGADTRNVLNNATPQQVKDHVKQNLEIYSKGGGFVFNTIHNIMPDVPPQNILAKFEAVHEFK